MGNYVSHVDYEPTESFDKLNLYLKHVNQAILQNIKFFET